ncbi:MAG TPA: molybdopterin-binding protein [Rickettsiales bacterium]|nr:molybdopterin-binding protein [Rickettsiales bacterium]
MKKNIVSAAFIIIGDEILSGRTNDQNLNFLAINLSTIGINLREVRVVADITQEIIDAINALRHKFDYVFTSGGIGPTHDDITSQSIAKAFNVKIELNKEAEEILHKHYGVDINEARLKMAMIPTGASLLNNPISSAPGFRIKNVFVMAGVPKIFQAMFAAAKKELIGGEKTLSQEIKINLVESKIAKDFEELQKEYPNVTMGSYPFEGGTSLVFRSIDEKSLLTAKDLMTKKILAIKKDAIII